MEDKSILIILLLWFQHDPSISPVHDSTRYQRTKRNGVEVTMRVLVSNSSDQNDSATGKMAENGRSRRKRMPKMCDCCGPNRKPHSTGHEQVSKKRGRRKKPTAIQEEVDGALEPGRSPELLGANSELSHPEKTCDGTVVIVNGLENSTHVNCTFPRESSCPPQLATASPNKLRDSPVVATELLEVSDMETHVPAVSVYKFFLEHQYCKPQFHESSSTEASRPPSASAPVELTHEGIVECIHDFLEQFYCMYGSFTPLSDVDVLDHLNKIFQADLSDRMKLITAEILKFRAALASAPMHFFQVTYNKHTLTLDDLSTLDDQNWVNDQVINMYGELIMEATNHQVHFFNSFFYRQFVAKGYEGVRRWTKKVDLFSKWLILIPLHLEIHWSLVSVDVPKQCITFYDSQGILFKFALDNILKYILAEAKEKTQQVFQKGWKMHINKAVPQQKNDNDCGVFVLEYCKCLAFLKPLTFSQDDMPSVRKRIYRELCDRRLKEAPEQLKTS
ncbi:hypothetical protein DNTS_009208 [Danionella cerebrum]|uniref:Ubiquitin-like protease family profile domain-containing protein n=1 Tax=Danionella cerebrum TaxID=2873325 RepID=A0A553MMT4_9TELE|nr:hypothetical protein DNTS_009208 [Danionella translucida]